MRNYDEELLKLLNKYPREKILKIIKEYLQQHES